MLVQGNAGAETLSGGAGADTIIGGGGADRLTGGGGADLFKFALSDSTVAAPAQITDFQADDRIDLGLEAATDANIVVQTATALSAAINQAGAAFAANSVLRYVSTQVGSNLHIFGSDSDGGQTASLVTLLNPGAGLSLANITGFTPVNPNLIVGTNGDDALNGTGAADTLQGGGGNDTIFGWTDADVLTGGAGNDLFKFAQGDSNIASPDQITDFQAGDRLDFGLEAASETNIVGQSASSLNAAISQAGAAFAANSALRYASIQVGGNVHIFATDADGGQAISLVTLINPGPGLSVANITGFTPVNPNLLVGTSGPDSLTGTANADTIQGAGGDDTITGGLGGDLLTGGAGADLFKVGNSGSTLAAPDRITDFTAVDRLDFGLEAASETNIVAQSANSLSVATTQANAALAANNALRYVSSLVGADVHIFASTANGGQAASLVTLISPGANLGIANIAGFTPVNPNLFTGTAGPDLLTGTASADTIQGNGGADTIIGGLGADRLTGGAGVDLFKIAPGDSTVANPDQITDFQSDDRLDFGLAPASATNAVSQTAVSVSAATTQAGGAFAADSALRYVATTVGGNLHIFASDSDGGQTASMVTLLNPGAGLSLANITGTLVNPNLITGTANADTLQGSATAAETLQGLAGNDTLIGDGSLDTLYGGEGDDTFKFDIRSGGTTIDGGNGVDIIDFSGSSTPGYGILFDMRGAVAGNSLYGDEQPKIAFSTVENLRGTQFHDILIGDNGANLINGEAGDDAISGMDGDDTIYGGDGEDRISGNNGADMLYGGAGNDIFSASGPGDLVDKIMDWRGGSRASGVFSDDGDQVSFGTAPGGYFESTAATYGDAYMYAQAQFNGGSVHYGMIQVGADVFGFGGAPMSPMSIVQLVGVSLADVSAANIVGATPPVDPHLITGTDAADLLTGTSTADTISAASGADTITGGQGADMMTGGAGNDLFKFAEGDSTPANPDQITDFASGDRLDFGIVQGTATNYVENSAASLAAATTQANAAFAANSALRYVATQVGSDVQLFATDANGGEAHSLVTLKNITTASIDFANILGSAALPVDPYLIVGTEGADTLVGTTAPETINGLGGSDTITGGGNVDVLSGGGGDDLFKFAAGDSIYAASTPTTLASYGDKILDFEGGTRGTGVASGTGDKLDFGFVRGTATNYLENTAASQGAAVTQASATFAANSALRYVATQVGADVLVFASGAGGQTTSLVTLSGAEVGALGFLNIAGTAPLNYNIIDGTEGRDTLVGGTGNDSLTGFADHDSLYGGAGSDTLLGDDGLDTLVGGLGNDRISGGANEDRFIFGPGDSGQFFEGVITPGTADIITDFQTGADVLTFGTGPANGVVGGNYVELSPAYTIYADAQSATSVTFQTQPALTYVVAQVGQDTYVFVDTGGTPDADTVVYLQGVALSGISASDIV